MTERWRLFVAVPIGDDLRTALATAVEDWRSRPDLAGLRWTDPHAWHVTLLFLGHVEANRVPALTEKLVEVAARHEPMELATGSLGGFGSAAAARVAWYGVDDRERRLRRLADDVRVALAPDEPARFRAHVTLARARVEPVDLRPWIADARPPGGRLTVDEIRLMRSHLGRGPARYEVLVTAPLRTPVHV